MSFDAIGIGVRNFIYAGQAIRVIFGSGSLVHLEREMSLLGVERALVLAAPGHEGQAQAIADRLGDHAVGVFARAVMHVPIETARAARDEARRVNADCAVAIGGGSTIGLGKAIALESSLPILAVPTTYAGSEMTPIYGITEAGLKKTGHDARVLPRTVIYDPELTLHLPARLTVTSAINAIAHAVEGLYAQDSNPVMDLMAEEGIRAIAAALPVLASSPTDIDSRTGALYGAWLCGTVLGNVGMSLHHKLCHTLGGTFGLAHADVHAVVLPQVIAFNRDAAPVAMRRIERALGVGPGDAASAMFQLAARCHAPTALRKIGMHASDLDRAAELAVQNPYWNPRPIDRGTLPEVRQLLRRAFDGVCPD